MKKNYRLIIPVLALSFLTVSCVEEARKDNAKQIQVIVGTVDGTSTKSSNDQYMVGEPVDMSVEDLRLTMTVSAGNNNENPFVSPLTKGVELTTTTLADIRGRFDMFIPGINHPKVTVSSNAGKWAIDPIGSEKAEWIDESTALNFYAFSKGADATVGMNGENLTAFSYKSDATDAAGLSDFLYASTLTDHNNVNIRFHHALAAVKFFVGDLPAGCTVKSISLKNIYTEGNVTVTGLDQVGANGVRDLGFNWTVSGAVKNVTGGKPMVDGQETAETTFFVIPQSVTGVKFEIVLNDGSKDVIVAHSVPVPDGWSGKWEAGKYYTFRLSGGAGNVGIDIDEYFDNQVKSSIKGSNTKGLTSYVRAMVVGNWCNSADKVVAAWEPVSDLTAGTDWVLGADGFYYYKNPVPGYEKTTALFTDAINIDDEDNGDMAANGLHLVVTIVMQAVEYDSAKAAVTASWGSSAAGLLN